eukprot:CAMPEP_0183317410 /NCGR_PEP_ID=MMETSP0160_2-20130417/57852_1 /TAXON_ID=2839 ORGANISM="Odontella Sinensis, Strain Grunow 1884" /NCGR_SAMPLE_ID=MMETSP0160_2 /ASSEMBLY_ACC=CAM_ASM_000250 /LENGTH=60 /DNA_ID=CAMNT_0025483425 /DNA_START=187 /DNA_END=369 /DNA_ORIENTATION=-
MMLEAALSERCHREESQKGHNNELHADASADGEFILELLEHRFWFDGSGHSEDEEEQKHI